ncbi:site-specific integrase [bacterium]|nr:site-specific integrase [bacterium]
MSSRKAPYSLNKSKYLTDFEFEKLESLLNSFELKDFRNVLLLRLALATGGRASELLAIKKGDLDAHERTVSIKGLKGSRDREIPLKNHLFEQLLKQAASTPGELVFPISYNRLRQIWQLYRPVHKKFHCLRHTFAIRLYKKTKDVRLLQMALGHTNIVNTMIYADYVYSREELRKLLL